ncbi:MAG: hypothetical protein EBT07_04895 [Actinobacteria bacterium]|nr:hypothetical protein [Actinomycetota bacterium]
MSSVVGAYSQVAPFKRWVVGSGGGKIYQANGSSEVASPAARTVLQDMGKTVFLTGGGVLRKVRTLPFVGSPTSYTGYIWISDTTPSAQNVSLLN